MKQKTIYTLLFLIACFLGGAPLSVHAQPALVKKAAAQVFTLTTFAADGTILGSSHGVFTGKTGEAVAMWHPFKGAGRAVVVDAKGKQYEVDVMIGASELYDICRFKVKGYTAPGLPAVAAATEATALYGVDYDLKQPAIKQKTPLRTEKFMETYNYYVFDDVDVSGTDLGCPLVDGKGQLVGIMQRPERGGQAYSADIRLTNTFTLNGMSINDQTLKATGIRTALPDDEQGASLMLMLAAQQVDSAKYDAYIDDYFRLFPTSVQGYSSRASRLLEQGKFEEADRVLNQSLKSVSKKDEAYSFYARMVYNASVARVDTIFGQWNLARALQLAQEADKLSPSPFYKQLQAQIIYAQGDYQKALDMFTELQQTELGKNGDVYYAAAQCKEQLKAPQAEVMALLDKAVQVQGGAASAPYVLARGRAYDTAGEYRKAFMDYLKYDSLVNFQGTHEFYYIKFQCEMKIRQFQLALNDIAHAIVLNRYEPTYYAEMASLQLRVNKPEDAIRTCDLALNLTQEYADLYIIKGMAHCELKQNTEGLAALQKAQELGDPRAADLIKKYSK